jgi:hypothetical protein
MDGTARTHAKFSRPEFRTFDAIPATVFVHTNRDAMSLQSSYYGVILKNRCRDGLLAHLGDTQM